MSAKNGHDETEELVEPIDEDVRAEISLIYQKACDALLFVKTQQWWTVGSTLMVFLAFMAIAKLTGAGSAFADKLTALLIVVTCAAIFMLVIYQFWQHNELARIAAVTKLFSPAFRKIQALKSPTEGDIHRYTLLGFMVAVVILGAIITHLGLHEIVLHRRL